MNRWLCIVLLAGACGSNESGPQTLPAPVEANTDAQVPPSSVYDLALPGLEGDTLKMSAYRGQHVLVNFWATWCAPCRQEIPDLISLRDTYAPRGFDVVGISMDVLVEGGDVVTPFVQEYNVDYPIVMGDQRAADAMGGMFGLPTSFLVGPEGEIIRRFTGLIPVDELGTFLDQTLPPG